MGYSPLGHKESDRTEQLTLSLSLIRLHNKIEVMINKYLICMHYSMAINI